MNNYISHAPEAVILCLVIFSLAIVFKRKYVMYLIIIIFIALLCFYRGATVPDVYPKNVIVSPCDGRVLKVVQHPSMIHVSVFLNIHNVHVQYAPLGGRVKSITHKAGEFHPAYFFEKSQYNERVETILETAVGDIKVVQLAGQVARRIVSFLNVGEEIARGQPIGLIKFGSRVDMWIPSANINKIHVKEGDRLRIGEPVCSY